MRVSRLLDFRTALPDVELGHNAYRVGGAMMQRCYGLRRIAGLSFTALLFACSALAGATPVSVEGGFTSFTGPVGGGQYVTTINGSTVCPGDPGGNCSTLVGPASVTFGSPQAAVDFSATQFTSPLTPNAVSFTPASQRDVVAGQEFLFGTMSYTNGIWFGDADFGFTLTSVSDDLALNGHKFNDTLHLIVTPNSPTNTPFQNSDFVYFVNDTLLGSARAFELGESPYGTNIFFWQVFGMINSLDITRFANGTGGGFLDPSIDLQPTVGNVPEPATLTLLGVALAGVAVSRRKRH